MCGLAMSDRMSLRLRSSTTTRAGPAMIEFVAAGIRAVNRPVDRGARAALPLQGHNRGALLPSLCTRAFGCERAGWFKGTRDRAPKTTPNAARHAGPWPHVVGGEGIPDSRRDRAWTNRPDAASRREFPHARRRQRRHRLGAVSRDDDARHCSRLTTWPLISRASRAAGGHRTRARLRGDRSDSAAARESAPRAIQIGLWDRLSGEWQRLRDEQSRATRRRPKVRSSGRL